MKFIPTAVTGALLLWALPALAAVDAAAPAASTVTAVAPAVVMAAPATTVPVIPAGVAAAAPVASSAGNLFQVLFGLLVVLAILAAAAWMLKRFNVARSSVGQTVKIVGGVSVGNRERVMVIEVGDQWIVVGVAPGTVNALSTMPRQATVPGEITPVAPNFASWLKQTIDKRNANQA